MGGNLSIEFDGKKYEGGSIEEVVRSYVKANRNENMFNSTKKIVDLAMKNADISKKSGGKTQDQLYNALNKARDNLRFGESAPSYDQGSGMLMFGNPSPVPLSAMMMGDVQYGQFGRGRRTKRRSKKRVSFGKKSRGSKKSRKTRRA